MIGMSSLRPIILIAGGCFNPPTIMHLRIFELAKDYFQQRGHKVLGGVISPTHDSYEKKSLIPSAHRVEMVQLALRDYDFVKISTWEVQQNGWTRTREMLQHHEKLLNQFHQGSISKQPWMPDKLSSENPEKNPKLIFLCGADLLESFSIPNLWNSSDIEIILRDFGLAVITREGSAPDKYIDEHETVFKYKSNVNLVIERVPNLISSTSIRSAVQRGESIRFLVPQPVIDYIYANNLYRDDQK